VGGPEGLLYDPATREMLVVSSSADDVIAYNATTDALIGTVPVGIQPIGIGLDPANGMAYVANLRSGNLTVISPATLSSVGTVPVGGSPYSVVYDPTDHYLYVAQNEMLGYGYSNLTIVNPALGTIVKNLTVGPYTQDVAYSPSTQDIYVAAYGNISVVSSVSHTNIATLTPVCEMGYVSAFFGFTYDSANHDMVVSCVGALFWISPASVVTATAYLPGIQLSSVVYDSLSTNLYSTGSVSSSTTYDFAG